MNRTATEQLKSCRPTHFAGEWGLAVEWFTMNLVQSQAQVTSEERDLIAELRLYYSPELPTERHEKIIASLHMVDEQRNQRD